MNKVKVGVVGCGDISGLYFQGCKAFGVLEVVSCADLMPERAKTRAEEFGIPRVCTLADMVSDPQIDIVLNITIPQAHSEVAFAALEAGKSVYNEKPIATSREDGRKMLEMAKAKGLKIGAAPDTFLGGGIQTCIKLINDGWIGQPVAATAFMTGHGPESWHPRPDFYYKKGCGPMFDMGPYYLTAMVAMMGPVRRVTGSARITFPERVITNPARFGDKLQVETPTHVAGLLEFGCGAVGTIITSCDVWAANLPRIEIYGTEGSISVPDPNTFGGPVKVIRAGGSWMEVPLSHGYAEQIRAIGLADMAYAMRSGRKHRASGDMAFHVLDIIQAFHDASDQGRHIDIQSTCDQPAPLPMGLMHGLLDA